MYHILVSGGLGCTMFAQGGGGDYELLYCSLLLSSRHLKISLTASKFMFSLIKICRRFSFRNAGNYPLCAP